MGSDSLGRDPIDPTAVLLQSCGKSATAGLSELIEKCRVDVIASTDGVERLKESLPGGNRDHSGGGITGQGLVSGHIDSASRARLFAGGL